MLTIYKALPLKLRNFQQHYKKKYGIFCGVFCANRYSYIKYINMDKITKALHVLFLWKKAILKIISHFSKNIEVILNLKNQKHTICF